MTDKQVCNALAKLVKTYKEYRKACFELEKKSDGEIIACEPMERLQIYKGVEKIAELIDNECVTVERKDRQFDLKRSTVLDGVELFEIASSDMSADDAVDETIRGVNGMIDKEEKLSFQFPDDNIVCKVCAHKLKDAHFNNAVVKRHTFGKCEVYDVKPKEVLWEHAMCPNFEAETGGVI